MPGKILNIMRLNFYVNKKYVVFHELPYGNIIIEYNFECYNLISYLRIYYVDSTFKPRYFICA